MDKRLEQHFFKDIQMTKIMWKNVQHHYSSGKCKPQPQWNITPYPLGWPFSKQQKQEITIVGEDME